MPQIRVIKNITLGKRVVTVGSVVDVEPAQAEDFVARGLAEVVEYDSTREPVESQSQPDALPDVPGAADDAAEPEV